jgi:hypothetical protein
MSPASLTPAEVAAMRKKAAAEVLAAAAAHSLLTDQLHELDALRRERPWTPEENAHHSELRMRLEEARQRHDGAHRRLRAISAFRPRAGLTHLGRPRTG